VTDTAALLVTRALGRSVLQFSGGKDSLACLQLCRPWLHKIIVLWANPGHPYPETVAFMAAVRASVPHFVEVHGEQPTWTFRHGLPVDVLPILHTTMAQESMGRTGVRLQSTFDCCRHNLWEPLQRYIRSHGVTLVIRGQKDADALKGPLRDGEAQDGVTYHYPLQDWTDERVVAFLHENEVALPPNYAQGVHTSLDCWDCTGYAQHNQVRWATMAATHPDLWAAFSPKITAVREALGAAITPYVPAVTAPAA